MGDMATFVAPSVPDVMEVQQTSEGPSALIAGEEYPLMEEVLFLEVIHSGHLENKERRAELKPHVGKFYSAAMEESMETLRLLPIAVTSRGRRLWPPYDSEDKDLLCYSIDGENPASKMQALPPAPKCGEFKDGARGPYFVAECPKAKWPEDGQKGKPECAEIFKVAFLDVDRLFPLEIQFKGKQISAWNQFMRSYRTKKTAARIKRENINDYVIVATTDIEGTYTSVNFKFENAKDEQPSKYAPLINWYWENIFQPRKQAEEDQLAEQQAASAGDFDMNSTDEANAEGSGSDDAMAPDDNAGEDFSL